MSSTQKFSFFERFISSKKTNEKLHDIKIKYENFINEMFSITETDEKLKKLEEQTEKLKRQIELRNLFFIDISCIVLFIIVGLQLCFRDYFDIYKVISVIVFFILVFAIFFNIYRNKIRFSIEQIDLIKSSFHELINPNKYYERLGVDVLMITLGNDLAHINDTEQSGYLLPRLAKLRKKLADEMGYIIPNVRVLVSAENEPREYDIWVRGKLVAKGEIDEDTPDFLDEEDVIINHLQKVVVEHVDYVFTMQNVYKLTELVQNKDATLIDEMQNYVDILDMRNILTGLLKKKRSIKDIEFIYQKIADYARTTGEVDELIDKIKSDIDKLNKIGKDLV